MASDTVNTTGFDKTELLLVLTQLSRQRHYEHLSTVVAATCKRFHTAVVHALLAEASDELGVAGPGLYGEVKRRVEAVKRMLDDSGSDLGSWRAQCLNRVQGGHAEEREDSYQRWLAAAVAAGRVTIRRLFPDAPHSRSWMPRVRRRRARR